MNQNSTRAFLALPSTIERGDENRESSLIDLAPFGANYSWASGTYRPILNRHSIA